MSKPKLRFVRTKFWTDPFIIELNRDGKLLFLYLLTNQFTNIAGIYEITIKQIAYDIDIKKDEIIKLLKLFQKENKLYYINSYIIIRNFQKNQNLGSKIQKAVDDIIADLPDSIKDYINTLSIPYQYPIDNMNMNMNNEIEIEDEIEDEGKVNIYNKFCNEILKKYSLKVTNKKDLKEYFSLFGGYEGFFKMVDRYFTYYNAFKLHGWDLKYRYGNAWHNFIDHMADFKTGEDLRDKLESKGKRKIKKKLSPFGIGSDEEFRKGREDTEKLLKKIEEEKKNESIM